VHPDEAFDNVVLFEVGETREALRLCDFLKDERAAWLYDRDDERFVAALLGTDPCDLATLLRSVEIWAFDRGLLGIRFELDGRAYALRARRPLAAPLAR
jgi:hypothetical protein